MRWGQADIQVYAILVILTLCILFFGHHFETYTSQQLHLKKVFGQTVTHEARQPLSEISILSYMQKEAVKALSPVKNSAGESGFFIPEDDIDTIY